MKRDSDTRVRRLAELREALVALHKALIDSERIGYERTFGTIATPGDFLQLVIRDPWFAWLRPVSELIVSIDEACDAEESPTPVAAEQFLPMARALLVATETGHDFSKHYFDALQRDPDVVLAHAKVAKLWAK